MTLIISALTSDTDVLPPKGGRVKLSFEANATGGVPSHMKARFWIDPGESFAFALPAGAAKEVFFPAAGPVAAPTASSSFGPVSVTIEPVGPPDPGHSQPLQINLELQGFDAAGNRVPGEVDNFPVLIDIDTTSLALSLLTSTLGVTPKEVADTIGVHPDTVKNVIKGGSSPKVREALVKMLRGQ